MGSATRQQQPLKIIAFHVLNRESGAFKNSLHTPEEEEVFMWLDARPGIKCPVPPPRDNPGQHHAVEIILGGKDEPAPRLEHAPDFARHLRWMRHVLQAFARNHLVK